ncbi:hypothetical protein [Enhygromyxa salina]|nr:hypothetical protein [Enhygromyxa salina]
MLASWVLCCVLVAAPPAGAEDLASAEAQVLFQDAQAKYETHDYAGAIELFTAAYARAHDIEDGEVRDQALGRLSFNLAQTHVLAYDIDLEPQHFVVARKLLADYRGYERALGRDPDVDTDVIRLENELAERERIEAEAEAEAAAEAEPGEVALPVADTSVRDRRRRRVGIALVSLAAPFGGLAVAGAVIGTGAKSEFEEGTTGDLRLAATSRGRTGDILLGVGVGLAVISAATGATLLGLSFQSERGHVAVRATPGGLVIGGAF